MSDEHLNAVSLMAIENNVVRSLDFESVINRFVSLFYFVTLAYISDVMH